MNHDTADCKDPTVIERFVGTHNIVPGEAQPRPCTHGDCKFAHDPSTAMAEHAEMLATEAALAADTTKAGKARFSKWRMDFAHKHGNLQPGVYGRPTFEHDFSEQILDPLHYSELGMPKTGWKHGVKNNASDDARELISELLKSYKHPLDMRRKEDGRAAAQKWFTGEKWATFCAAERGSPGGPIAIATIMMIVADDLLANGYPSLYARIRRKTNPKNFPESLNASESFTTCLIYVPVGMNTSPCDFLKFRALPAPVNTFRTYLNI